MDEDPQAVIVLFEDVVGVPAHDDAALLVGKLPDGLYLGVPQLLAQGAAVEIEQALGKAELHGHLLVPLANLLRSQVGAGLGGAQNDVPVVEGDAQLPGQPAAQLPAAGAEFSADGDDTLHKETSSHLPLPVILWKISDVEAELLVQKHHSTFALRVQQGI